ncbi:hypothetical protein BGZ76_005192 [Entomortierella beljakovae]|nr:hypothetical protein BGZ76_005192 [Entomortierella beljakovae]
MEWYQKASSQGHSDARHMIGHMYHYGEGVSRDIVKAREWYLKAVNSGNTDSQTALDAISKDKLDAPDGIDSHDGLDDPPAYLTAIEATSSQNILQLQSLQHTLRYLDSNDCPDYSKTTFYMSEQ